MGKQKESWEAGLPKKLVRSGIRCCWSSQGSRLVYHYCVSVLRLLLSDSQDDLLVVIDSPKGRPL